MVLLHVEKRLVKVVVVGAGIAGLCTAAGLASTGARVTVVERAPEVRGGGAGLSIFANGIRALDSLGLRSVIGEAPVPTPPASGTRTPDGRWLSRFDPASLTDMRVVRRADLHAALLGAVAGVADIRTGSGVEEIAPGNSVVRLADGTEIDGCDLIVGADGLRSRVRGAIVADPGVRRCGYAAWRAVTSSPVAVDAAGETTGRGARFGIAPLADGHVYWFASVSDAGDGAEGGLDEVRQRFSGWHRPIGELLDATDPATVGYLPIEELASPLPTFVGAGGPCGSVLVGDAAHAMTPNLGQGANQAMEDAATLVALLRRSGHSGLDDALRAYDRLRRPRTQRIARQASMIGRVGQMRAAPAVWARDLALRMTPDAVLNAQMRRVQQWQPPEV
ncbi:2-polyprenyl-6-methoxyphenol hydroxylase-related FAD-dependent oxidoreductase [Gordonia terrae C-6]|uniref:2-polyprenyl-6-methoxyphenol hydroxylase-related FAD-dependent oxidoreductase n=1 Tax=Gordonia terrae C-6 TaxID=1316928 RepID=R7YG93_9ACTN|nr:2-polyprenyl-6-methoxyphenol hydroxylase-related FAD-dependent oxidoreductase [Gordonia terrae C-6]